METTAVASTVAPTPASSRTPTTRGLNQLKSEDFFKLLITELQLQDPLKPNDSQQLVQEMSTIRQMESSAALEKTLGSFAEQQRLSGVMNLIGRYVTGTVRTGGGDGTQGAGAQVVEGVVVGVMFESDGNAVLELADGQRLPARDVTSVRLVDPNTLEPLVALPPSQPDEPSAARARRSDTWVDRLLGGAGSPRSSQGLAVA